MTPAERARALLTAATSRGAIKRLSGALDQEPGLREAVLEEGRRRGAELPDEALRWPAKRLLRVARARASQAQVRTNPIARDERFVCARCGAAVQPAGYTARDHCPRCLCSLHVDVVPGDRAATCGGILQPIDTLVRGDVVHIRYRCERCGVERRCRALLGGDDPDDWSAVVALSAEAGA